MASEHDELFLIDGNSLAYRAFFALPESIATSTGEPTNAIFGFASMLVKILTDYGPKGTVVVWDAGMSGRKEVYDEYKAQRRSRPDLLKEQWPHLAPLVEAFGYRNVSVEGYEADDVIAAIVEKAKARGGAGDGRDRRPRRLPAGRRRRIRIMTTSRGITDTKIYDREGVIDRYGIPPELVPDFIGLKGDTSDNIPGVPGIGDKTAAQLLQEFGSLEGVLENVDRISGAKRKQNLTEHAEDARISKRLATMVRDIEVDVDPATEASREPDRSQLRDVFRRFELRDPLRRVEEALDLAEAEPVPVAGGELALSARVRESPVAEVGKLKGDALAIAVRAPEVPEDALFSEETWRFGAIGAGDQALAGDCAGPEELVAAAGERPVAVHDAKALRAVPPNLAHDTMVAAYLIDPAARAYPFDELCSDRGVECDVEDPAARDACPRPLAGELAARDRCASATPRACWTTSSCRSSTSCGDGGGGPAARHRAAGRDRRPRARRRRGPGARDLGAGGGGVHDRLAAAARRRSCSCKLGARRASGAGKTGYSTDARVLQAIRSTSTRSSRRSSAGGS